MTTISTGRQGEILAVFDRARVVIRAALESQYLVPEEDLEAIECSLYEWFDRFSRRPDCQRAVVSLRPSLFRMTCKAAQDYWLWKHHGGRIADDSLRGALSRDPEEIAIQLETRVGEMEEKDRS